MDNPSIDNHLADVCRNLGIGKIQRHIFICADQSKPKCATREASVESWDYLKKRLAETGLTQGEKCVFRTKANCLRVCEQGPVAVVYPEGTWYTFVDSSDIDEIVDQHLVGGKVVERLVLPDDVGR